MKRTHLGEYLHGFSPPWLIFLLPLQSGHHPTGVVKLGDIEVLVSFLLRQNHCHSLAGKIKIQVILGYKDDSNTTVVSTDISLDRPKSLPKASVRLKGCVNPSLVQCNGALLRNKLFMPLYLLVVFYLVPSLNLFLVPILDLHCFCCNV